MIVVMNCVNLRGMKQARWLSSPRWMGRRSCKVRTHDCRTEGGDKNRSGRNGEERKEGSLFLPLSLELLFLMEYLG